MGRKRLGRYEGASLFPDIEVAHRQEGWIMNVALWIGQVVLAVVFAVSGSCKATWAKQKLIDKGQTGVVFFPLWAIRAIAAAELLAVVALILPRAVGAFELLTPLAATGICGLMIGAAVTHSRLREPQNVAINTVIFAVAALVAIGRF
jgi:hypothetical protein